MSAQALGGRFLMVGSAGTMPLWLAAAGRCELVAEFMTKTARNFARKCHKLGQFHICSPPAF